MEVLIIQLSRNSVLATRYYAKKHAEFLRRADQQSLSLCASYVYKAIFLAADIGFKFYTHGITRMLFNYNIFPISI